MSEIVIIAHDIRSAHNIGALLRTADCFDVHVYISGHSPYPLLPEDDRLPHISTKLTNQIRKTALGAETNHGLWSHKPNIEKLLASLRIDGYEIVGLEQARDSVKLPNFRPPAKIAILLGREVEGIDPDLLKQCETIIEIPMLGQKESLNVTEAATAAMYHCRFNQ